MIRFQIIERDGAQLYRKLVEAMREGELRTFHVMKRGHKVVHQRYPGWIRWGHSRGVIDGTALSPKRQGNEWQIFSALLGRLAHKYADSIAGISVQFPQSTSNGPGRKRMRR